MNWSNAVHNIINVLITLISALAVFDWTAFFAPERAVMIVGALSLAKLVINVVRDGVSGLTKVQPPVME